MKCLNTVRSNTFPLIGFFGGLFGIYVPLLLPARNEFARLVETIRTETDSGVRFQTVRDICAPCKYLPNFGSSQKQ